MNSLAERSRHDRTLELAASAIDGPLSPAETLELDGHLSTCPACARTAAAFRSDAAALALPLAIIPSRRVDAAVDAAIARPSIRSSRSLALVAAAALLVLALLGAAAVGAYLLRRSETPPISVDSSQPPVALVSPAPDASPAAPESPPPVKLAAEAVPPVGIMPGPSGQIGLDWSLAHTDVNAYGESIANGPAGWLHLISSDDTPTSRTRSRMLLSPDLRTWIDVGLPGADGACLSLGATRSSYVALCTRLWRSSDGRTWTAVSIPPQTDGSFKGGANEFYSDGTRFLATAGMYPSSDRIWTSDDGDTWTSVHLPDAPLVMIDAVVGRAAGGFLVAGRAADTEADFSDALSLPVGNRNPGRQAIWESPDGVTWRALALGTTFDGARITGLASDGPGGGILAIGHIGEAPAGRDVDLAVWRSVDSLSWQRLIGPTFELQDGNIGDAKVIGLADRWLITGDRKVADPQSSLWRGVVAGSQDGTSWWGTDPIWGGGPSPYAIQEVIAADGRLVAIDATLIRSDTIKPSARIWVSP